MLVNVVRQEARLVHGNTEEYAVTSCEYALCATHAVNSQVICLENLSSCRSANVLAIQSEGYRKFPHVVSPCPKVYSVVLSIPVGDVS
jgi:hypothetical protein